MDVVQVREGRGTGAQLVEEAVDLAAVGVSEPAGGDSEEGADRDLEEPAARVARDAPSVTAADVERLRAVGLTESDILDAFRSMSKDLFEITKAFRPRPWTLFRVLILPTIIPGILTAWKVNLGNAARVVVVAELVGATGGVGYQLLRQQQLFDMAGALAWTLQLVLFVLVVQQAIVGVENFLLRYRAVSERAM